MDKSWTHDEQEEKAYAKGIRLLKTGFVFGECGTRRRRDLQTQELVIRGLARAKWNSEQEGFPGLVYGTSNVYVAMKYGLKPMGIVGHE
jgi:nicotinate phosphoribosyltransferase